jgi:hypothetical protein
MAVVSLVVTLLGLTLVVIGCYGLWRIDPTESRFRSDLLDAPPAVPNLMKAQRRPTLLIAVGSAVQVLGGVLAVVAYIGQ